MGIGTAASRQLCRGRWLQVRKLQLEMRSITGAAAADLITGTWPAMQNFSFEVCDSAIPVLVQTDWSQLQYLTLRPTTGSASETGLTAVGLSNLNMGWWPMLKELHLSHVTVDAATVCLMLGPKHNGHCWKS